MNIIDTLADRAYIRISEQNLEQLFIENKDNCYKVILEDIYKLLQSEEHYSVGVRYLCFACEHVPKSQFNLALLKQCIQSSRIFLYANMLEKEDVIFEVDSLMDISQKAFYSLESDLLLTKEQKDLYDLFMKKRKLVVSAPTSFGKSRIIREIIAHNRYKTIAVVVPTNALLSETYFSFRMDERFKDYTLVYSTHSKPLASKSIYIFTPEKFDAYTDENKIKIDLFVFDEVYKVGAKDRRSSVFASCLYKAFLEQCDYYLIGPYFKSFSKSYLERTNGHFKQFKTDIVQKQIINYFPDTEVSFSQSSLPALKSKDLRLKHVLNYLDGQTIVYVNRKDSAEVRAKAISKNVEENVKSEPLAELIAYIKKTISKKWSLISYLEKGVAFHHAGIPKFIQTEIVELFNQGVIKVIVCTPTLTEGVNTTAKNVVFYDTTKSDIDLTGFEVKNIVGRSGRFGQHFIGRAIFLENHIAEDDIDEISFPIFDNEIIPKEDNIQIEYSDLNDSGKTQRADILEISKQFNIPLDILKKNKYVSFDNQLNLIAILREQQNLKEELYFEKSLPAKQQIDIIIKLVHEVLFSENERRQSWTTNNISRFVKKQLYFKPSLKSLIKEYDAVHEDTKIRNVLSLIYTYFEFSLPKYITTLETLYNYVYEQEVSFSRMLTQLQYGSNDIQDILLADAGLPRSIIQHLSPKLKGIENVSDIRKRLESNPQFLHGLSNLEIKMLSMRL